MPDRLSALFARLLLHPRALPVLALLRPDLGHSIDDEGLKAAIAFAVQNLSTGK